MDKKVCTFKVAQIIDTPTPIGSSFGLITKRTKHYITIEYQTGYSQRKKIITEPNGDECIKYVYDNVNYYTFAEEEF